MKETRILSRTGVALTESVIEKLGEMAAAALENAKNICVEKIMYKSLDHSVAGFVVYPTGSPDKKKLPCIIWNRGGSLDFGAIKTGQLFLDIADLARAGYFVIASQYSGWGDSGGVDEFGELI